MVDLENTAPRHRATYTFEMGVWRATCRVCGYSVTESRRSRAASQFRNHIRDSSAHASAATEHKDPDGSPDAVLT
jgi:hypothetical protein